MTSVVDSEPSGVQHREALNPELARLLALCNLDRNWKRAHGVWLYDQHGRAFLDCYGQYGALALGHNAPAVVGSVRKALGEQCPAMVQPYRAPYAVELARELVSVAPDGLERCVFTTSGAETVEAAIKLVRARTTRHLIVSCEGGFHGKTLAAMAASGRLPDARLYGPALPGFAQVPFANSAALEAFLQRNQSRVAAVLLEPIQGESGVRVPAPGYLSTVRALCSQYGVAMVLDEIQTGLGRTGRLFACEEEGVHPDLLLLSKAIGGGLFPLGACLARETFWDPRFAINHSSTFANNNLACRAGLAVLETLTTEGFCDAVKTKGELLLAGLHAMAERYPTIVAEVRGRGLLTALELRPPAQDAGMLLSYLYHQRLYAYGFASTLAERESVLVLPTLGDSNVIRIAPPLTISHAQIKTALAALDAVLGLFARGETEKIARAIGDLGRRPAIQSAGRRPQPAPVVLPPPQAAHSGDASFAFIIHPTTDEDVIITDPRLAKLSAAELHRYGSYLSDLPPGVVLEVPTMRSTRGASARGWLIGLGMSPREMATRGRRYVSAEIKRSVELAALLGAKVVGLGAFTTLYSRHGKDVLGLGPAITTGNTLTAVMAVRAVKRVLERRGQCLGDADVGVVGAVGSVGNLCARLLARETPRSMMLVGRPSSSTHALARIAACLEQFDPHVLSIGTDLSMLRRCSVVLSATSSGEPILDDIAFQSGTIVCDVARPADSGERLRRRTDITVINAGLVSLPDASAYLGAGNLQGFPAGVQLACLSETILLAMAGFREHVGVGREVDLGQVDRISALADEHGFTLAEPAQDRLDHLHRRDSLSNELQSIDALSAVSQYP